MRLPIVMTVANRALSGPLSIWNDHGDIMAARTFGWIQIFTENGQEAFDHSIMAFKIAETTGSLCPRPSTWTASSHPRGWKPTRCWTRRRWTVFLPALVPYHKLDPQKPRDHGRLCHAGTFTECKMAHQMALTNSYGPILEIWQSGASSPAAIINPWETYRTEGPR